MTIIVIWQSFLNCDLGCKKGGIGKCKNHAEYTL